MSNFEQILLIFCPILIRFCPILIRFCPVLIRFFPILIRLCPIWFKFCPILIKFCSSFAQILFNFGQISKNVLSIYLSLLTHIQTYSIFENSWNLEKNFEMNLSAWWLQKQLIGSLRFTCDQKSLFDYWLCQKNVKMYLLLFL